MRVARDVVLSRLFTYFGRLRVFAKGSCRQDARAMDVRRGEYEHCANRVKYGSEKRFHSHSRCFACNVVAFCNCSRVTNPVRKGQLCSCGMTTEMAWFHNPIFGRFFEIGLVASAQRHYSLATTMVHKICIFPKEFASFKNCAL
jgi:hypothetical protein